jgi:hypothetical protein
VLQHLQEHRALTTVADLSEILKDAGGAGELELAQWLRLQVLSGLPCCEAGVARRGALSCWRGREQRAAQHL